MKLFYETIFPGVCLLACLFTAFEDVTGGFKGKSYYKEEIST